MERQAGTQDDNDGRGPSPVDHHHRAGVRVIVGCVRVYQRVISPALPRSCRFYPTCSEYAVQAVTRYGALKGGRLAVKRILRCHPFSPGGYDPVP
jgi:putative membrane protein insertion efficiency factor